MDLHEYLYKNDINHVDFSKMIGVSRSTLHRLMTGQWDPPLSILLKIEKVTKDRVKIADFIKKSAKCKK